MKFCIVLLLFGLLLSWFYPIDAQSCTTFCIEKSVNLVFGKNYDWPVDDGLLIVNKRNVSKTAMGENDPVSWTSRYGSITFNQYGRELPSGGMNEMGLVIEKMWLDETVYPESDSRHSIGNLQWIQDQLDNFSTIKEVIASDSLVRINPDEASRIHYLVCDRSGHCASIEFLNGKMVYHTGETMSVTTLTNDTYIKSLEFLKQHAGFGGESPIPQGNKSLERFVRATNMVENYEPQSLGSPINYAFQTLDCVSQGEYTKWQIVYDINNLRIYFRTFVSPQVRFVELDSYDFSCSTPVKVLDINENLSGDVASEFNDYAQEINLNLIRNAYGKVDFLQGILQEALEAISRYPESTVCQE